MDYIKEYKSFIHSYYFAEGVRITVGVTLPAIVLNYFGLLPVGLAISLGAICVSVSDIPGPVKLRRNGMLASLVINFFVALITGFVAPLPVALGVLIFGFCFLFSMVGVYGGRVNSIGVAGLLVMVLSIYHLHTGWEVVRNALFIAAGGVWYILFSLALYSFRPYRLVQQALGDSILAIADYLRTRALFYDKHVKYDAVYRRMMEEQAIVQQKQLLLRELIFKSRNIIKESTTTGRTLLMIFTDTVDLFERITTTFYAYESMHTYFDNSEVLPRFQQMIYAVTNELDETGIAIQSGSASREPDRLQKKLEDLQAYFKSYSAANRNPDNLEAFISLKKILQSLEDITARIYTLHHYSKYDTAKAKEYVSSLDHSQFVTPTDLGWKTLRDNFSWNSSAFRHALRVSIATAAGYIVSHLFEFGHGYWILLTIVVILKPAYSVSRERNYQRLGGTIAGALIGLAILYFVKDTTALFIIMLVLMTGAYSFMRTRYLVSVVFMTPYILIMFYLLGTDNFQTILRDRLLDTAIGSGIAFGASFLLVPAWEHVQMRSLMADAVSNTLLYYKNVTAAFAGTPASNLDYKLSRKNAFVALANLSEAFTRMLSEPKSKQKNGPKVHQFVVMNHMLNSHIATLAHFSNTLADKYRSPDFTPIIKDTVEELEQAKSIIQHTAVMEDTEMPLSVLSTHVDELVSKRRTELQQGLIQTETREKLSELKPIVDQFFFISRIAGDIKKISEEIEKEQTPA